MLLRLRARWPLPAPQPPSRASFRPKNRIESVPSFFIWFFRIILFTGVRYGLSAFYPPENWQILKHRTPGSGTPAFLFRILSARRHRLVYSTAAVRVHTRDHSISMYAELLGVSRRCRPRTFRGPGFAKGISLSVICAKNVDKLCT